MVMTVDKKNFFFYLAWASSHFLEPMLDEGDKNRQVWSGHAVMEC